MVIVGIAIVLPLLESGPLWKAVTDRIVNPGVEFGGWWRVLSGLRNVLPFDSEFVSEVQCV